VLSFPDLGHPLIAWLALTPLLVSLDRVAVLRAFLLGLTTGVVYFAGTLYWVSHVMVSHGGLHWGSAVLVNVALIAYLSLFPATFAAVVNRLVMALGPLALLATPLAWVSTELGRTYLLFDGFPWVLLGYSQMDALPVAQFASIFGVYGVSGVVAAVSAGLALGAHLVANPANASNPAEAGSRSNSVSVGSGFIRILPALVPVAIAIAIALWGAARMARSALTAEGEPIRVGLLQGNVDQAEKWDPARAGAIFANYLEKTEEAIAKGAEVVIWPEASTPFTFEEDRAAAERVRAISRRANVALLIGSNQIERGVPVRFYNAAFMVGPDGTTQGVYRKMHLVPFGEYVPYQQVLFFAAPLVEAVGAFSAGDQAVLLPIGRHLVSTAICYEVVYPALVRRFVSGGSELLTTITNDAWFGRTSAPHQHFAQASMRAIENGRYLVRAANTGISGVVDPYGRVLAVSGIFEPSVIVSEARFLRSTTFYARHGDVFAYGSVMVTIAMLVMARGPRRRMETDRKHV
jgi:apolipoprotein N-acyltransferase